MTKENKNLAKVFHFDLYGKREVKYDFLNENTISSIHWNKLEPNEPNFFLVNKNTDGQEEYEKGFKVDELFKENNAGLATEFDEFSIKNTRIEAEELLVDLKEKNIDDLISKHHISMNKRQKVKNAINDIKLNNPKVTTIDYRPFDAKYTIYTGVSNGIMGRPRNGIMKYMLLPNIALLTCRQQTTFDFQHIFLSNKISERCSVSLQTGEVNYIFPLYLYPEASKDGMFESQERVPNLNMEIVEQIGKNLGLTFAPEKFPSSGGVVEDRGGKFPSTGGVAESRGGRNTQNYMSLPYNPKLKEKARALRKAGNLSEVLFWNQVKNKQFKGLDFDRQKIIGNYIVDFYCTNCNVVIEIDGSSHDNKQEYDEERNAFLESLGLTVIHIPVVEVMNNMSGLMRMLEEHEALTCPENVPPRSSTTPPMEGNVPPRLSGIPPVEGNLTPIDVLDYIYAVLHSPTYREKYKEFLRIDFPRVPYPKDPRTFWQLVKLGGEIRQIHLLESAVVEKYITQYPIDGDNVVGKPRFINSPPLEGWSKTEVVNSPPLEGLGAVGKVYINETQYFDHVPQVAWEFYIGGYQPAQKWLKDRKDRKLEFDDILHYQKIIVALSETNKLMNEINKIDIE